MSEDLPHCQAMHIFSKQYRDEVRSRSVCVCVWMCVCVCGCVCVCV